MLALVVLRGSPINRRMQSSCLFERDRVGKRSDAKLLCFERGWSSSARRRPQARDREILRSTRSMFLDAAGQKKTTLAVSPFVPAPLPLSLTSR